MPGIYTDLNFKHTYTALNNAGPKAGVFNMTPLYKIPGLLLLPSGLLLLLLILAIVGPKAVRRTSAVLALVLVAVGSVAPLSSWLLQGREASVSAPLLERASLEQAPHYIVVLGNGHVSSPHLPLVSQFYYAALARITQGVVLAQQFPHASLVFTGYGGGDEVATATKAAELAMALGISESRIFTFTQARNTAEEAAAVAPLLAGRPSVLVTSASHLPRALKAFKDQNLQVVGYPTGHLVKNTSMRDWHDAWPQATQWAAFENWVYEMLADFRYNLMSAE